VRNKARRYLLLSLTVIITTITAFIKEGKGVVAVEKGSNK
jgi:hypothetical protein